MGTKLFVTKLSYKTTDEVLEDHFSPYGKIIWCQVVKDRDTGASKRYGFVTYESSEDGEKALKELHGTVVDGCRIAIEKSHQGQPGGGGGGGGGGGDRGGGSRSPSPRRRSPSDSPRRSRSPRSPNGAAPGSGAKSPKSPRERAPEGDEVRLFVGGLPDGVHEDHIMELFKDAEPVDAFVCRDKTPPCGFITLRNTEANIEKAKEHDGIYFKGSKWRLVVKPAKPPRNKDERSPPRRGRSPARRGRSDSRDRHRRSRSRSRDRRRGRSPSPRGGRGDGDEVRLFVGGLPSHVRDEDLLDFFRKCDPTDAFVPRDKQRQAPFYGFVAVRNRSDNVKRAIGYDGDYFEKGCEFRLTVQYSKPRKKDSDYGRRSPSRGRYDDRDRDRHRRYSRSRSRDRYRRYSRSRSR